MKKKILTVILALLALTVLVACGGQSQEEQIRRQLDALDSYSFSDIQNWINNELPEFEDVELSLWSITDEDDIIREGILEDEERFIHFRLDVGKMEDESILLFIELIYEALDLGELLREELGALNTNSFSDIMDWLDQAEDRFDDTLFINTRSIDEDGGWLDGNLIEDETQFVEWEYDIDDTFTFSTTLSIYFVYNRVQTFGLGDTFEQGGLEVHFGTDIVWGQVNNEWSREHGVEFFKVPVTIENISNSTINSFFPIQYGPDGRSLDSIWISDAEDDITFMGGLRPGAYHDGYLYFRYEGDGDYVAELRSQPFSIEVIIPIDAYEMRGPAPAPPSQFTIEDFVEEMQAQFDDYEDLFEGMIELSFEVGGDDEIIIRYIIMQDIPAHEIPEFQEIVEEYLDAMEAMLTLSMMVTMMELGIDSVTLTTIFEDINGTELFARSLEF